MQITPSTTISEIFRAKGAVRILLDLSSLTMGSPGFRRATVALSLADLISAVTLHAGVQVNRILETATAIAVARVTGGELPAGIDARVTAEILEKAAARLRAMGDALPPQPIQGRVSGPVRAAVLP
jgi:hypothetical protein